MEKEGAIEKSAGSLPAKITMVALAAFSGNPLAIFLPLLTDSLAGSRHKRRVEKAIKEIERVLEEHGDKLKDLSDSQYKIISEAILTVFQTIERQKLEYLKCAIKNTFNYPYTTTSDAERISRIIRDISADEAAFLIKNQSYELFQVGEKLRTKKKAFLIKPGSQAAVLIDGLTSLGLMVIGGQTWDELFSYRFTPLAPKIIKMLQDK